MKNDTGKTGLSHLDDQGQAKMVDVTAKVETTREAVACGLVRMQPSTVRLILEGGFPKGDVFSVARVAGIMAAKKTHIFPSPEWLDRWQERVDRVRAQLD